LLLNNNNSKVNFWFTVGLCYLLVIALGGYRFGVDDMTEGLSYAKYLGDQSLYQKDLYIQSMAENSINERIIFASLLSFGNANLPLWCQILHAFFSIILIIGLYNLSSLFILNRFLKWVSVLVICLAAQKISLGGNEIYANYLVPSLAAKAMGVWAVFYILKNKWTSAFILMIPITFIQPIVGAQLILIAMIGLALSLIQKKTTLKELLPTFLLLIPICSWLYYLLIYINQNINPVDHSIDFWTFIHFRMPHHFLIEFAGLKDKILSTLLYLVGILLAFKYYRQYLWFIFSIIGIAILYVVFVHLEFEFVLKTQWLKTSIWLEALCILIIFGWTNQKLSLRLPTVPVFGVLFILSVICIQIGLYPFSKKEYYILSQWKNHPEIEIAESIKSLVSNDVLIAVPPDDSRFRFASEKSIYVDFKSIAHNRTYQSEWYRRIKLLYGVNTNSASGFEIVRKGLIHYLSLNDTQIATLCHQEGIDYWLTYESQKLNFPIIVSNNTYILYKIPQ
jgi:hypothetical protein